MKMLSVIARRYVGRFGRWFALERGVAIVCVIAALIAASPVLAEGSRTMFPSGIAGARAPMDVANNTVYAGLVRNRTFIYVYAKTGEYILTGSRNRNDGGDIFIYNPQSFGLKGNETIPATADFTCSVNLNGAPAYGGIIAGNTLGVIASRAEELAGPNSANNGTIVAGGWRPCAYRAPSTGIYGVRFTGAIAPAGLASGSVQAANTGALQILRQQVSAWEVVVRATNTSTTDLNGRVFTYGWTARVGGNGATAGVNHALYYVTQDGYRYKQTMKNLDAFAYGLYSNSKGFLDAGNPLYKSVRGDNQAVGTIQPTGTGITAQAPEYPIFFANIAPPNVEVDTVLSALSAPIPLVPPTPSLSAASFAGDVGGGVATQNVGGTFTFTTVNTLSYEIVISRNGVNFDPANVLNKVIAGTANTGTHTVVWNGLDNSGLPFPVGTFSYRIAGRNGEVHFPIMDTEGMTSGGPEVRQLNGSLSTTVFYDDRGYVTSNGTAVGELNGHICGAGHLQVQTSPNQSLAGVNSTTTYRSYPLVSNDPNNDCTNTAATYFGTAKGLDTWALERTPVISQTLEVVLADMSATLGAIPNVISPGQSLTGLTLTCLNNGPNAAVTATCLPTVDVGSISDLVCSPNTPVASLANGNSIICTFTYTGPGTAGGGDTPQTAVLFAGTTGATNDSVLTNNVDTAAAVVIDAVDDVTSVLGGLTGQTFDLTINDQFPIGSAFSIQPGSTCANSSVSGIGVATYDATPSPCAVNYQVCAPVPNSTVCDNATLLVTSITAEMEATLGAIPADVSPGQSLIGLTLSCANISANTAISATCAPSVDVGTISNLVCVVAPPTNVAAGDSITCTYDYLAPGVAGGSDTGPVSVTFTGTTGAANDTNAANNVDTDVAAIIDALDDTTSVPSGARGQTFNLSTNDEFPVGSSFTQVPGSTCANPSVSGVGVATFDATPNPCTVTYQVCAPAPNGTVCDNATLTVTGLDADMEATLGAIPADVSPGQSLIGLTLSCANISANTAISATCAPSVDVGTISNLVCAPLPPTNVLAGASISCTYDYLAPGVAGGSDTGPVSVTFTGTTGAANDTNAANNVDTDVAAIIDALDDTTSVPSGATGQTFNLSTNDEFPVGSSFTQVPGSTCANPSVSGVGVATFDATPNPCTVTYQVCAPAPNGTVCDNATLTVTGLDADMEATLGAIPADVSPGQSLIGLTSSCANISANTAISATCAPSVDVGTISNLVCVVAPPTNVAAGDSITCTYDYLAPGVAGGSDTGPVSVTFTGTTGAANDTNAANNVDTDTAAIIDALDDGPVVIPATGGSTPSVLSNDTLGPAAIVLTGPGANASLIPGAAPTPSAGSILMDPTTGIINVANGTTAGTYAYSYQICTVPATLPPTCDSATATVEISASPSLTIDKTAGVPTVALGMNPTVTDAGDTIAYSFLVTNTGNVTLTGIAVNDAQLDAPAVCALTTLIPGANTTCTGTHTITLAEINAGTVNNSATSTGTPPVGPPVNSPPDTTETPIARVPSLTIDKTAGVPTVALGMNPTVTDAGDTIAYSFLVTNTGNVTLTGIAVNDAQLDAPAVCALTTLIPGANTTCTGTHTITLAEINAGTVNNSATSTGTPPVGPPVNSPPDTTETPIAGVPSLTIDKTAGVPTVALGMNPTVTDAGDTIAYSFLVTNTGNVTLTGIAVNDAQLDAPAVCALTTLIPGANTTCTGTHTITLAEINAGTVNNSATATGTPPVGPPVNSPPDTTETPMPADPRIDLAKTADAVTLPTVGQTITYTFVASNTGNVTLTNVGISDPLPGLSALTCAPAQPATLNPGQSISCSATYLVSVTDLNNGGVTNTATASGTPPSGPPVTDTDTVPIAATPVLNYSKQLTGESLRVDGAAQPGEELTYTITVRNDAGVAAPGTIVIDSVPLNTVFVGGSPTWSCATNSPGGTACQTTLNVPAFAAGSPGVATATFVVRVNNPLPDSVQAITNVVTINTIPPVDCAANPMAPPCVITPTLNLRLAKTVDSVDSTGPNSYTVRYALTVRNVGGALGAYTLNDTLGFTAQGVSFNGSAQVSTTGGTVNPALAGGSFTPTNGVTIQLSAADTAIASGSTHTYALVVPISVNSATLGNGACTGTSGNGLFNASSVTGAINLDSSACAPIALIGEAAMSLLKTVELAVDFNANGYGDVGDVLNYALNISNVGTQPLGTLRLVDSFVIDLQCDTNTVGGQPITVLLNDQIFFGTFELLGSNTLIPGDSVQCWATHTLTAADVAARRVTNTASASGEGTAGGVVTSNSTAIYSAFP